MNAPTVTPTPRGYRVSSTGDTSARLSFDSRRAILDMTAAGRSTVEIAIAVGCSSRTVTRVRRDNRLT